MSYVLSNNERNERGKMYVVVTAYMNNNLSNLLLFDKTNKQ